MTRMRAILTGCERTVLALALLCLGAPAWAASVIRDAETEAVIDRIADPIFTAARLDRGVRSTSTS